MTGLQEAKAASAFFDPASRGLGVLIPVVGAHGGVGASGVALALADALDVRGMRVLLVDGADSARSGLADVWTQQLRSDLPTRSGAVVTTVRRGGIIGRQAQGVGSPTLPRAYPYLDEWASSALLSAYGPFDATVVDIGWDPWLAFSHVDSGPLAWLTARPDSALGVLVAQPTKPSMRLTTGVAARWQHHTAWGPIGTTPHLIVTNATVLNAELRSHAGSLLLPLLDHADLMPPDPASRIAGWTTDPTPTATSLAAQRVLAHLPQPLGPQFGSKASSRPSRFTRRTPKEI